MLFFVLVVLVLYANAESVAGWNRGEAFVLASTCFVLGSVMSAFFMSVAEIPSQVRLGTLDTVIAKPVDTQFWVSMRRFNFDQLGSLIAGAGMLVYGVLTSGSQPSLAQWAAYLALAVAATLLYYSLNLAMMTLGIWLVKVDNLWVLGETAMQVARFPLDIYNTFLQKLLIFYIPLGFLATVPARQLTKGLDLPMVGLGLFWSLLSLAFARWFWRFALRHYSSASS